MLLDFVELRTAGLARPLFADFLAEADTLVPGCGALATEYRRVGQFWTELAEAALPSVVPAFGITQRLRGERALLSVSGSADAPARVAEIEAELDAIDLEVGDCFPLDEAQCGALRRLLHEKVVALHEHEARLQKKLGQLARAYTLE